MAVKHSPLMIVSRRTRLFSFSDVVKHSVIGGDSFSTAAGCSMCGIPLSALSTGRVGQTVQLSPFRYGGRVWEYVVELKLKFLEIIKSEK